MSEQVGEKEPAEVWREGFLYCAQLLGCGFEDEQIDRMNPHLAVVAEALGVGEVRG